MEKRIRHFVGLESSKQLGFIDHLHNLGLNATVELPEVSRLHGALCAIYD
jgi:hypothetical protein